MDELLARFPKSLPNGVTLRPLKAADEASLADFFRRIPVDERQLFKDDVTRREVIHAWIKNLDYANILPILALQDGRIVADATLHRDRGGWSRHVARIRLTLDPGFRGRGLGRALVREFIDLAASLNIAILTADVLDVQKVAQDLFEALEFVAVATLPQQAIDLAGRVHDVVVYSLTVIPPEKLAREASLSEDEADVGGGS
jgi:RimJ/RimL family protein N-acetyltransferase